MYRDWPNLYFSYAHRKSVWNHRLKQIFTTTISKTRWTNIDNSNCSIQWPENIKYRSRLFLYYYKAPKGASVTYLKICLALHPAVSKATHLYLKLYPGAMCLFVSRQQELRYDRCIIWYAWGLNNDTALLEGRCNAFLYRRQKTVIPRYNQFVTATYGSMQAG